MNEDEPDNVTPDERTDLSGPTRREIADWIVAFVREQNPPAGGVVKRADLEALIGEQWDTPKFAHSIQAAIDELDAMGSESPMLFRREEALGLVRLTEAERIEYATRKRLASEAAISRGQRIMNNADRNQLSIEEKAQLDRERMRQIHIARELARTRTKRWIEGEDGDLPRLK
jgi:hypothetical protein